MDAISRLLTLAGIAVLILMALVLVSAAVVAAWSTSNRKGLIREASLTEEEVGELAESLFERFSEKVRYQDQEVDISNEFDKSICDADRSRIVQVLLDKNLVVDVTKRTLSGSLHDWTFCSPPRRLKATDIGWHDLLVKRAVVHQPRPYIKEIKMNHYETSPHIETKGKKAKVRIRDVAGNKILNEDQGMRDVVAALVEALAKDAQSLEPTKRHQTEEFATSLSAEDNEKRLREVVASVVKWVGTIGTGMEATNEVLKGLGELAN